MFTALKICFAAQTIGGVIIAVVDWSSLTNSLVLALIGAITAWTAWRTKRDSVIAASTHALVNSQHGSALLAVVLSARALKTAKPTPENSALLKDAEVKYLAHQEQQAQADRETKSTP